jgi:hypothetical protein
MEDLALAIRRVAGKRCGQALTGEVPDARSAVRRRYRPDARRYCDGVSRAVLEGPAAREAAQNASSRQKCVMLKLLDMVQLYGHFERVECE